MMKQNRWMGFAGLSALMISLLAVWGPASPGQAPAEKPQVVWEYKVVEQPSYPDDFAKTFESLGSHGWEYGGSQVAEYRKEGEAIRSATLSVFKRPRR